MDPLNEGACFDISKVMEIRYHRGQMASKIHHPSADDIDLANVLRTVGDPARLEIVRTLGRGGEQNCSALQEQLDLPISTCSYHLKLLREAGVTRTRAEGTLRY